MKAQVVDESPVNATDEVEAEQWSRFTEIETDRYLYNPNAGSQGALTGYLINVLDMPPIKRGRELRPWSCLLIKLTEPASVIDRNKDVVLAGVGSEVLIPATFTLHQHLSVMARAPKSCYEIKILPKDKVDIGSGQTLWRYRLGFDANTVKPRIEFGPSSILGAKLLPDSAKEETADKLAEKETADNTPF